MSLQAAETLNNTTHDLTTTSKQNRKIEKRLEKQLNGVVQLIRKIFLTTNARTTTSIRILLDSEITEILQSSIQQSYQLGIAYVSQLLKHEAYLTSNDLYDTEQLVREYNTRFWGRIEIYLQGLDLANTRVHSPALVTSLALDIATKTLNLATRNRTRYLIGLDQLQIRFKSSNIKRVLNPSPLAEAGIKDIENRLADANPGFIETLNPFQPFVVVKLVWIISEDDKVCPQCQDLYLQEWDWNDFDIPTPGHESTHWNCRCRLMIAERELE